MKLTVGKKIILGYCLAMLFMALTAVAGYRGTERLLLANYWVRHTYLVIGEAKDIRSDLEKIGTIIVYDQDLNPVK